MSLLSFLAIPEVVAKVKPLRPKLPRRIDAALKVTPRTDHYQVIGRAIDYLLRFELQRRAPYAVTESWVAEAVPDLLWKENKKGGGRGIDLLRGTADLNNYMLPQDVGKLARVIVKNAKVAVADYLMTTVPKQSQLADLAAHAIRLANLEPVFRARRLDPHFNVADPEDVKDLLDMLEIVPFGSLLHENVLLLNPTFKESSDLVGGADADLIAGDLLVDFKATKKAEMSVTELDQILGYYLLARNQRRLDLVFPEIKRAALYFCRHGYLWVLDVNTWTDHPEFLEIEKWFLMKAKEVFGPAT